MEWRSIPDFRWYEVNEVGEVRSWRMYGRGNKPAEEPHLMKTKIRFGKPSVILVDKDGKRTCRTVDGLMRLAGFPIGPTHYECLRRPIVKLDMDGNLVEQYPSLRDCARAHYIAESTLHWYLKGKNKKPFDRMYTFRYADDYYKQEDSPDGTNGT